MALSRDIVVRLQGDADSLVKAQKAAADAAGVSVTAYRKAEREFARQQQAMETASRKQRAAMESVGRGATVAGAAIMAGLGMAIKAAVDWESAWTGVLKTVDGSPAQLKALEGGLRDLARTLPATHAEIAAVAEAAGQMGVATDSIVGFTRTMINLGETTNLSADQAATSLAQMMNVMKTAPADVDRLGSTLVELGNAGASTEADIMDMAQRLAGAGALIGASESDVLALASAMADMGIQAELGGGAMSRVMLKVYEAMQQGGEAARGFADVAGMSAEEFAAKWSADPVAAIDAFVQGLGRVKGEGGNVVSTLGDLGISGTQNLQVMLSLAAAGDGLTNSLNTSSRGWEENTALVEEAAKRYDTTAAKTEMARNALNDAAIEIGDTFLPMMASLAESVADVGTWFAELPDPIKGALGGLAGVTGTVALVGGAFLLLAPRVMDTYKAFQALNEASPRVASGLGKVGRAAGIAGALIAVKQAVDGLVTSLGPAAPTMEETTQALLGMGKSMEDIDAMFKANAGDVFGEGIDGLADAAERLGNPGLVGRFDDFTAELLSLGSAEGRAERERIVEQLDQIGRSLGVMVDAGNAELAAEQFDLLAAEWERGGGTVAELRELMPAYGEALAGVANDQTLAAESAKVQAESSRVLAEDLGSAYGSLQDYAAALGMSEDATEDMIEKSNELGESLGAFVDPLGAYTELLEEKKAAEEETARATAEATESAEDSWEDYVRNVDVTFDEYVKELEAQVAAQDEWQMNMLLLAGRVSEGTLAELARMGPEGAALVAELVTRSDDELDHFDELTAQRAKEATDAWGAQLTLATPVLSAIAAKAGKGAAEAAARELAAGTKTIAQIAQQYGIELAEGVNPILVAVGKGRISGVGGRVGGITQADGGVVSYYADGGMESHVAQIAPAGSWRVWAEPETGGEAYIPLSPSKRGRSMDIWRETGRRLGVHGVQHFASGGFTGVDDIPRPPSTSPAGPPLSTAADAVMQKAYADVSAWMNATLAGGGTFEGGTGMIAALQFARSQVGKPYIWGGAGPQGYDCSGFMSAITNIIRGRSPYSRVGSTGTFPWAGFQPGYGAFTIGSSSNTGSGIGHMAGTLLGVNVESRGGDGVVVGGSARGASDRLFYSRAHLAMAKGGILNPHIRDRGGPLLPGYTYNGLTRPEQVVPIPTSSPMQFVGDLYLDSGEFLGKVRGVAHSEAQEVTASAFTAFNQRRRYGRG